MTLMFFAMMAAMMLPTVWPWVRSFHRFVGAESHSFAVVPTSKFIAGYLFAWLGYSILATVFQQALQSAGSMNSMPHVSTSIGAVVFMVAGLYQMAPPKRACLTHCRSPFSYFLARWHNGPASGFRMGLGHGVYCVGCCWALMATTFAVGVMSLWWMATIACLTLLEQVAPHG